MTDWTQLAAARSIPPEAVEKIVPVLEALEKSFQPLAATIPAGADLWTGPENQ